MAKKKAQPKSWTFLVYMAGDNNLDPNGVVDLKEMKKVGSTDDVNIVAQFDRASGKGSKRYFLRKGGTVESDAVATLAKRNTGDPKQLIDFISWGVKTYPANHYIIVLWNHGQGWDDTDIYAGERFRALRRLASGPIRHALFRTPVRRVLKRAVDDKIARAILLDDDAKDFLDNLEMKKVLVAAAKLLKRKVDILGMDACLMSMAEVGYQVRDSVAYTVGSEETEPLDGWPYDSILTELAKNPAMTPKALSSLIVKKYLASYTSDAVTQSACDLATADRVSGPVTALATTLKAALNDATKTQQILVARTKVQSYEVTDNIDIVDFCSLLAKGLPGSDIAQRCQDVIQAVQSYYVIAHGFKGASMKNSNGLAIYFPTQAVSPLYAGLDFSKKTGWDAFLKAYINASRSR